MTKQKTLRRVSVAVIAVLLITMSLLCVTLAKYTTQITGTSNGDVLKWSITVDDKNADYDITAVANADDLYPGMQTITKTIVIKNEGELDADLTVALTEGENKPTNLQITLAQVVEEGQTAITVLGAGESVSYTLTYSWDYDGDDGSFQDAVDLVTTVKVTATQVNPNANN